MLKRNPFIVPSALVQKQQPPSGPRWLHEVKFDGFRAQLHKHGDEVTIYSRNGHYTRRFSAIRDSLISLPTTSVVIDAEVVVCDSDGKPDFKGLMEGATREVCAWCFDLLELKGCCFRDLLAIGNHGELLPRQRSVPRCKTRNTDKVHYLRRYLGSQLVAVKFERSWGGLLCSCIFLCGPLRVHPSKDGANLPNGQGHGRWERQGTIDMATGKAADIGLHSEQAIRDIQKDGYHVTSVG